MEHNGNDLGPKYAIRLGDLRRWHIVTVTCFRCGHKGELTGDRIARGRDPYTHLVDLQRKLRCTNCTNRRDNTLSVRAMSRD